MTATEALTRAIIALSVAWGVDEVTARFRLTGVAS